jgi:hypothetical protein
VNRWHRAVALGGFIALDVGLTLVGDTPDTRDTPAEMAAFFVERRHAILIGTVVLTAATWAFAATVLRTGTVAARNGQTTAARVITVAGAAAAILLLTTVVLPLSALAYVVAATDPAAVRPVFSTTLVATPLLAWPLAVLHLTTGVVSWRGTAFQRGIAAVQLVAGGTVAVGVAAYAERGYFSPDVQQQVALTSIAVWLLTAAAQHGRSTTERRLEAPLGPGAARVRRRHGVEGATVRTDDVRIRQGPAHRRSERPLVQTGGSTRSNYCSPSATTRPSSAHIESVAGSGTDGRTVRAVTRDNSWNCV